MRAHLARMLRGLFAARPPEAFRALPTFTDGQTHYVAWIDGTFYIDGKRQK